jgi:serine/threonine-protein kinase
MLDPQASRFWQTALLSGLLDAERLSACWNAIAPEKRRAPEHLDRRLARKAVAAGALTLWQAQHLLAGRIRGYKVDRYVLTDMIGEGGMGRVYLATDTRLKRPVALKILAPERVNNPRAVARFQREGMLGAQLQHENLVRIYDSGESCGRYYLVMEHIDGKTVETLIAEEGSMPPAPAVRLVRQVALGLEHLHRKGLIHRDVNPRNILVTRDGIAKLADLGLAVDLAEEERVTREGATVGTLDYLAPEQARDSHAADIRSDVYSLGCTLYRLISGQVPFPVPSLPGKLLAHQSMSPTPLHQLVPGLAADLADVVARMMRKSPDERYATPSQVAHALKPFEHASNCVADGEDVSQHSRQPVIESSVQLPQFFADSPAPLRRMAPPPAASLQSAPIARVIAEVPFHSEISTAGRPATVVAPVADTRSSDPDFPFLVDLGPEPGLSEHLSRASSRFRHVVSTTAGSATSPTTPVPKTPTSISTDSAQIPWWPSVWAWGVVALLAVVTVSVATLAIVRKPDVDGTKPITARRPGFVVRLPGGGAFDDEADRAISLFDAMRIAMASRGYVELSNSEPLRLASDQPLDFGTAQGKLDIRAAPGTVPVVEVELNGTTPLLQTGSAVPLELTGLKILVRRKGALPSGLPPPLIVAAGKARLVRCAFEMVVGSDVRDSRAVLSSGGALEVDRCWFQGFDKAIDILASHGNTARLQQTMIVASSAPRQAPAGPPELHGWGVRLQHGWGGPPRRNNEPSCLILDGCTFEGAGLLELGNRPPPSPYQVEVKHCAVRADALLAWEPNKPDEILTAQIKWLGEGNQYDIRDRCWIVLSESHGTPTDSTAVTGLDSWSRVARENEPIRAKLTYRTDPLARSGQLQPHDLAISHSGPLDHNPGANPELVGPRSKL